MHVKENISKGCVNLDITVIKILRQSSDWTQHLTSAQYVVVCATVQRLVVVVIIHFICRRWSRRIYCFLMDFLLLFCSVLAVTVSCPELIGDCSATEHIQTGPRDQQYQCKKGGLPPVLEQHVTLHLTLSDCSVPPQMGIDGFTAIHLGWKECFLVSVTEINHAGCRGMEGHSPWSIWRGWGREVPWEVQYLPFNLPALGRLSCQKFQKGP